MLILIFDYTSTQYVADAKGYRPVTTYDPVSVFPRSGGERKASFVGDFSEDEQRSKNIRYFFPDGCRGIEIPFDTLTNVPPTRTFEPPKETKFISSTPRPDPITTKITTAATATPKPIFNQSKIVPNNLPNRNSIETVTKLPAKIVQEAATTTAKPTTTKFTPQPSQQVPVIVSPPEGRTCQKQQQCCSDDDSVAKLVLPVALKNTQSGACQSFAKLIIPIEGLSQESLKSLTNGFSNGIDTSDLIKNVLKLLS
jgi:hypothetical protein